MTEKRYGPYRVELSNRDKLLFPGENLTKGDLIEYYDRIAGTMLPHLIDRPLTLHRFPDGIAREGFYQQSRGEYFPDWLEGLAVDHGGDTGQVTHVLCEHKAALVYLANQGVISFHAWLSRRDHLRKPDQIILDLDPPGNDFEPVRQGARLVKAGMEDAGLAPFLKTTGSRGLHVVAPVRPEAGFDRVRKLAKVLADRLVEAHPHDLTTEQRKNRRQGRLYLDIMRIAFGQTAVAPYAVRALPGAPVATPIEWRELDDSRLGPRSFTMNNLFRRLGQRRDPWAAMRQHAVSISSVEKALRK